MIPHRTNPAGAAAGGDGPHLHLPADDRAGRAPPGGQGAAAARRGGGRGPGGRRGAVEHRSTLERDARRVVVLRSREHRAAFRTRPCCLALRRRLLLGCMAEDSVSALLPSRRHPQGCYVGHSGLCRARRHGLSRRAFLSPLSTPLLAFPRPHALLPAYGVSPIAASGP